jgi:ribosome-binding protein aMBF1 (putative translation factor)
MEDNFFLAPFRPPQKNHCENRRYHPSQLLKESTMARKKSKYLPERTHITLSVAQTIAMLRELKGWTQEELAKKSGIAASNISRLENGHLDLGKQRAIALAKAFDVHPATLMFPDYPLQEVA